MLPPKIDGHPRQPSAEKPAGRFAPEPAQDAADPEIPQEGARREKLRLVGDRRLRERADLTQERAMGSFIELSSPRRGELLAQGSGRGEPAA